MASLHLLSVEYARQEAPSGCLAACIQMALAHVGRRHSQQALNHLLGLRPEGVPASRIERIRQLGVSVFYGAGEEATLRASVERGIPPIVFVSTGDLPYWNTDLRHAVLVVGYDEHNVYLHDPASDQPAQPASWGDFMLAWSEFDYRYALIDAE